MAIVLLRSSAAWSLFSPEATPRIDAERWRQQAHTFLAAEISFVQQITDAAGELPERSSVEIDARPARAGAAATRVRVLTVPIADAGPVVQLAAEAVTAMGGAGFDALLARARRVWQVQATPVAGADARAPAVI